MYSNRFSFLLHCIVVLLLINCGSKISIKDQINQDSNNNLKNLAVKQKADTLIHLYAQSHPDSAINLSKILIHYFDSIGCNSQIFESYFFLSEIYLYKKSNDYQATYYYSEGLRLMLENNMEFDLNPFYLIDLGNILFRHRLYQHAIRNYQKAGAFAQKAGQKYAQAVALNNIGLSFQKMQNYDSSSTSFIEALELRKNIMPLLEAQNHLYLAKLYMDTGNLDSVKFHSEKIAPILNKQVFTKEAMYGIPLENAIDLSNEIAIEKELLDGKYLLIKDEKTNRSLAEEHFKQAEFLAHKSNKPVFLAQILTEHAVSLIVTDSISEAVKIIGEAFKFSLAINDMKNALYLCRNAARIYSRAKDTRKEQKWLYQALFYSDSLLRVETSDQLMADKILLHTAQTERELSHSKIILDQNKSIISNQNRSIIVLICFIITILAFMGLILLQRKKLNKAYHALVSRTLQIIQTETRHSNLKANQISAEHTSVLIHQLENLMVTGKHYLDPEISITKLSKLLGTNEKYLSQLINQQLDTTFNDLINGFRIKEACRILVLPEQPVKSLEQIAFESGFRSRSTFYESFKKYTGVTPAFFQKNIAAKRKNVL